MKSRVQETLDELLDEHLIPFALTAHKVDAVGFDEYFVPFYDSRLRSVYFSWKEGDLGGVVRTAVLNQVTRMSGPLRQVVNA